MTGSSSTAPNPLTIDPPGIGRFANGVVTFLSDETFGGKPITVRGVFSSHAVIIPHVEQLLACDAVHLLGTHQRGNRGMHGTPG